jgi:hypothetical protein
MGSLFEDIEPKSERVKTLKTPLLPHEDADTVKNYKDWKQKCLQLEAEMLQITRTNQNRKYKVEEIIALLKLLLEKEEDEEPWNPAIGKIFFTLLEFYEFRQKQFTLNKEETCAMHQVLMKNSKKMYFDVKKVFTEQLPDFAYHYYVLQNTLQF